MAEGNINRKVSASGMVSAVRQELAVLIDSADHDVTTSGESSASKESAVRKMSTISKESAISKESIISKESTTSKRTASTGYGMSSNAKVKRPNEMSAAVAVSYTHLRAPRDLSTSRMPSSA